MAKNLIVTHTYEEKLARALEPDARHARALIDDSVPPNTRRAYAGAWKAFLAYCETFRADPYEATPEFVASYLASLDREGLLPVSIVSAYSGISFFLRAKSPAHDIRWPRKHRPFVVSRVIAGAFARRGARPTQKRAIGPEHLAKLDRKSPWKGIRHVRNRAVLLLGLAGAMRRSEIAALNKEDLTLSKEGLRVLIRKSKTDQRGEGQTIGIPFGADPLFCAVQAIRTWCVRGRIASGPLFRSLQRAGTHTRVTEERMAPDDVAWIVKEAVAALGLDAELYAGHSLRRGFVTYARKAGADLHSIMRVTRHTSEKQARSYIEDTDLFEDNATGRIFGRRLR